MSEKKSYERIDFTDSVNAAKEGDMEAFQFLYNQSVRLLGAYVRKAIEDKQDVEDVLQEIYLNIFKELHTLRDPKTFMGWAQTIAHNILENYRIAKKRHVGLDIPIPATSEEEQQGFDTFAMDETLKEYNPEAHIDAETTKTLLMEILDGLPFMQRSCILLQMEQKTTKEIAQELEIPEGTVKSNLNYARQKIKAECLELEKKGTKLYGLAPIPFFIWLLRVYNENYLAPIPKAGSPASFEAIVQKAPEIFGSVPTCVQHTAQVTDGISPAPEAASHVVEKAITTTSAVSKGAVSGGFIAKVAVSIAVIGVVAGAVSYGVTSMIDRNSASTSQEDRVVDEDTVQAAVTPGDNENDTAVSSAEATELDYEEIYGEAIAEYKELFENGRTSYEAHSLDDYKYIAWEAMDKILSEGRVLLDYSFYDINQDGVMEMVIVNHHASSDGLYSEICDIFTTDGENMYMQSEIANISPYFRGNLLIYSDGIIHYDSNAGITISGVELYRIASDGYTLERIHAYGRNDYECPNPDTPYYLDNEWFAEYPEDKIEQLYEGMQSSMTTMLPYSGEIYREQE